MLDFFSSSLDLAPVKKPSDVGKQWKLQIQCCFFSTDSTGYHPFRYSLKSFTLSKKHRGPGEMSDNTEIFKHVLQKRIGNTEYWREIVIFEEGPFVFRVVQELQLNLIDSARHAEGRASPHTQPFGMDLFQQRRSDPASTPLSATKQR